MSSYSEQVKKTREVFLTGRTQSIEWRREQLQALLRLLDENRLELCTSLFQDLRKPKSEALLIEVNFARNDVITALNSLDRWVKPSKVGKNLMTIMDDCAIRSEPYGVALIMSAWNYPVQLIFSPLVGALAAGNCVVLKPSEISFHTAELIEKLIPKYFDTDCVWVVNGGIPETTALLKEKFDYIFYTGNNVVAKIIYEAAAKYLTPVTLELGGKSPVYVDKDCDYYIVSRRILWGKFVNSGQTCIAPDYIMCSKDVQGQLVENMSKQLKQFYGENPQTSNSYGRIVNNRHFNRVKELLSSGEIAIGGQVDEKDDFIAPTVLINVKSTDPVMQNEIFGPILPIMTVDNEDEAISFIKSRDKPLAMYIFSNNKELAQKIISNTSSGGVTVNDTLMHSSLPTLPFGGVGASGMGAYHGKFTFDTFSHKRAVLKKQLGMEKINDLRVPPYTEKKLGLIGMVLNKKLKKGTGIMSFAPIVALGVILAVLLKYLGMGKYLPDLPSGLPSIGKPDLPSIGK